MRRKKNFNPDPMPDPAPERSGFVPTMASDEAVTRLFEAKVRLTEARAIGEMVKAKTAQIELDKACGELVYAQSAMDAFNSALAPLMGALRNFAQQLVMRGRLTPSQHEVVDDLMAGIYRELSKVEFEFETATEVEKRATATHTTAQKAAKE